MAMVGWHEFQAVSSWSKWGDARLRLVGTRSRAIRRGASMNGLITDTRGFKDGFFVQIACSSSVQVLLDRQRRIARERVPTSCNAHRPIWTCTSATSHQPLAQNLERFFQVIRPENQKPFCRSGCRSQIRILNVHILRCELFRYSRQRTRLVIVLQHQDFVFHH